MAPNKRKRQRDSSPDPNAIPRVKSKKAKKSSGKTSFNFLNLPGELRNMIYSFYFSGLVYSLSRYGRVLGYRSLYNVNIQLMFTNCQIYQEASSFLYKKIFSGSLPWNYLEYLASAPMLSPQILGSSGRFRITHNMITWYSAALYGAMNVVTTAIGLGSSGSVQKAGAALTRHAGGVSRSDGQNTGQYTYVDSVEHRINIKWGLKSYLGESFFEVEGSIAALRSILGSELMVQSHRSTGYFELQSRARTQSLLDPGITNLNISSTAGSYISWISTPPNTNLHGYSKEENLPSKNPRIMTDSSSSDTNPSNKPSNPATFLSLPRELRDAIYDYHFQHCQSIHNQKVARPKDLKVYFNILLTNRQIYEEARHWFYQKVVSGVEICISSLDVLRNFQSIWVQQHSIKGSLQTVYREGYHGDLVLRVAQAVASDFGLQIDLGKVYSSTTTRSTTLPDSEHVIYTYPTTAQEKTTAPTMGGVEGLTVKLFWGVPPNDSSGIRQFTIEGDIGHLDSL